MDHPKYPLQDEELAENEEFLRLGTLTPEGILARRVRFNKRRDEEFPGWKERYDTEIDAWMLSARQMKPKRDKVAKMAPSA